VLLKFLYPLKKDFIKKNPNKIVKIQPGTRSPNLTSTISPTTKSSDLTFFLSPFLIAIAC